MKGSDNIVFRAMEVFANFFLLNTLWLLFCIPVLTIFPATKAMVAVTRQWVLHDFDVGVIRLFFHYLKEDFSKTFLLGVGWILIGLILIVDFFVLTQTGFTGSQVLFVLLIFVSLVYSFISVHLLFMLVNYDLSIKLVIKNAFLFSIARFFYTLMFIVIIAVALLLIYIFPFFVLILGSVTAYFLYFIFHKLVNKTIVTN